MVVVVLFGVPLVLTACTSTPERAGGTLPAPV
jgi:hypothetical protein